MWIIDSTHSSVEFRVKHLGVSWIKGRFGKVEGKAQFDPENLEGGSVEATISASSIWTGDEGRDKHLQSPDFFDAANNPVITFKSTGIEKVFDSEAQTRGAGENEYKIAGDLTMRGTTKPVTLEASWLGMREIPMGEGKANDVVAGITAKTVVNRHDYKISWDMPAGEGATTVGGEVEVELDIRLKKQ